MSNTTLWVNMLPCGAQELTMIRNVTYQTRQDLNDDSMPQVTTMIMMAAGAVHPQRWASPLKGATLKQLHAAWRTTALGLAEQQQCS